MFSMLMNDKKISHIKSYKTYKIMNARLNICFMCIRVKGPLRSTIVCSKIHSFQSCLYCKARRETCQARLSTEVSVITILIECFCGFDYTIQITNQGSVVHGIVSLAKLLVKGSLSLTTLKKSLAIIFLLKNSEEFLQKWRCFYI